MDFSKLLYEIVKIEKWISITYKLLHGFAKVPTWVCQSYSIYISPFDKSNQYEVWPRFQSFEQKALNESKYSMPLVDCACGNVLSLIQKVKSFEILFYATVAKTAKHFRSIELCTSLAKNNLCPNPLWVYWLFREAP